MSLINNNKKTKQVGSREKLYIPKNRGENWIFEIYSQKSSEYLKLY